MSNLNLNSLSPNIERVPSKDVANTSVALSNSPPFPNSFLNLFIVSSVVTSTPALKPSKALTPLSLNKSALPIPDENDLCICSAVVLKSRPVTEATLPVIANISFNSSAFFVTTAKLPAPACISSREKGTLLAKSIKPANALSPSLTPLNKKANLNLSCSTVDPTFKIDFTANPAPIPIIADCKENTVDLRFVRPALTPANACLVLSFANIFKTKFFAIIYVLTYSSIVHVPHSRTLNNLANGCIPILAFLKRQRFSFLTYQQR